MTNVEMGVIVFVSIFVLVGLFSGWGSDGPVGGGWHPKNPDRPQDGYQPRDSGRDIGTPPGDE